MKISLIITTYNWPQALDLTLMSLQNQTDTDFEIIIADDGSDDRTKHLIESWQQKLKQTLQHVWQEDDGFRAAKIRNKAIEAASGDYLIFLDGDCFVKKNFVKQHVHLAEKNYFVVGQRILCSEKFSEELLNKKKLISHPNLYWLKCRCQNKINRFLPLIIFPLGFFRKFFPRKWQGAKTCNLGAWKNDLICVNGFDESFQGWGYEDSDCVIRLIRSGIYRKTARFAAPVFHLWHKFLDRAKEIENKKRLQEVLQADYVQARQGLNKIT